jgi:hypothetical protein
VIRSTNRLTSSSQLAGTQSDGTFSFETLPGDEYVIEPLPPLIGGKPVLGVRYSQDRSIVGSLAFTVRVTDGGNSLLSEGAPETPAVKSIQATMSGVLRGTVAEGKDVGVVVLPENTGSYGLLTFCQSDGHFEALGLAPGTYYVAAFRGLGLSGLRAFGLLPQILKFGTKVTIEAGAEIERDLGAINWPQ